MSKANPIKETITPVPKYPKKLVIFKIQDSKFWWARVYMNKRYYYRSTKTEIKKQALEVAKQIYNESLVHSLQQPEAVRLTSLSAVAVQLLKVVEQTRKKTLYGNDKSRINKLIIPYFAEMDINEIKTSDIAGFIQVMNENKYAPATKKNYLSVLHKIFVYAHQQEIIKQIPVFPRLTEKLQTAQKRDYLTINEYKTLNRTVLRLSKQGVKVRGTEITEEMKLLIKFMINSFIRPSDLRVIKHKHIQRSEDKKDQTKWLTLTHPATKTTATEVQTMTACVEIYDRLLKFREENGVSVNPDDFLFYPQYRNRDTFMGKAGKLFKEVVDQSGLEEKTGKNITLYSLRHTAIMYRLIYGNVDSLTLAKNARTSQLVIERYYAADLMTSQTRRQLHSFI